MSYCKCSSSFSQITQQKQSSLHSSKNEKGESSSIKLWKTKHPEQEFIVASEVRLSKEKVQLLCPFKRKNSIIYVKKKKALQHVRKGEAQANDLTPFQNIKKEEQIKIQKKFKELKERNSVPFLLQKTVKNWLVISQIYKSESKSDTLEKSRNKSTQSMSKVGLSKADNRLDEAKEIKKPQNVSKRCKTDSDKFNNLRKDSKKYSENYISSLLQKLKLCTVANLPLEKQIFPKNKRNRAGNKLALSRSRTTSFNNSRLEKEHHLYTDNKSHLIQISSMQRANTGEALKCSRIDICWKKKSRPQTAIIRVPKANFYSKGLQGNTEACCLYREMSGWQDLADSFQRQIIF